TGMDPGEELSLQPEVRNEDNGLGNFVGWLPIRLAGPPADVVPLPPPTADVAQHPPRLTQDKVFVLGVPMRARKIGVLCLGVSGGGSGTTSAGGSGATSAELSSPRARGQAPLASRQDRAGSGPE